MRIHLLKSCVVVGLMAAQSGLSLKAQTVSTFENLTLSSDSYWDGSATPLGTTFTSGNVIMPNYYDTSFGGFWASGWAYSNMKDSTTIGFSNLYSARTAVGYNSSVNYVVGTQGSIINLNPTAFGKQVNGFYVTNGTYPAISMKDGDSFSKKFGGTSGNDPDWFKLTIRKWLGGVMTNDSVGFYLADYRFSNNAQDYIVTTWQWVDLSPLGNADSLEFNLSSSDVGSFGMNTPAYFCMDNFTTADSPASVQDVNASNSLLSIYPNPTTDIVNIDLSKLIDNNMQVNIMDVTGSLIYSEQMDFSTLISLNMKEYPNGIYFINIKGENSSFNQNLIKE